MNNEEQQINGFAGQQYGYDQNMQDSSMVMIKIMVDSSMDIIPIRMDSSRDLMEMALINRALV